MGTNEFQQLVTKYLTEDISPNEIESLRQLLLKPEYVRELELFMDAQLNENDATSADYPQTVKRIQEIVGQRIVEKEKPLIIWLTRRWAAVAAILIILGVGAFLLFQHRSPQQNKIENNIVVKQQDVAPGKEGAILTLSDNTKVVLDDLKDGIVTTQNGSKISIANGQLLVNASGANGVAYNTMTTPKGRQYQLVLSDGTKVWLNAASSIRFPTSFIEKERKVEITGEAYFEVAKDNTKPFHVSINDGLEVVVLGTHFNINSYSNENSVNTTLLEGSVLVVNKGEKTILKPGQQAQATNEKTKTINEVDLKKVMAWKDGVFNFQDASLEEVMRQLERWYDIEVVYEKGVPNVEFMGTMGRDLTLSEVLNGLKLSEVHFRIENGRKLVVTP